MARERRGNAVTYTQLSLGMAAFGSATPLSKIVTDAMPVFVGAALRMALGALVLGPVAARRRAAIRDMSRRDWWLTAVIALFGMFGFSVLMLYGMKSASGVAGAVVMSTAPAVTAAGAILLLGERATWRKLVAVGLAVAGVLLLQWTSAGGGAGGRQWLGVALVFGAVCCEATYTLVGRRVSKHADPLCVAFLASAMALPLFLPFAIWQWRGFDAAAVDGRAWLAFFCYGAGTLAAGSWLWYAGLRKTQASVAAGFMGVMPASALLLSYALLGERFEWAHLLGFGVVFTGVLLISQEHARSGTRH